MELQQPPPHGFEQFVIIFESELQAIAAIAASMGDIETGGDLFGLISHAGRPVISLATPPGPAAIHEKTHFRQDVLQTRRVSRILRRQFGVQFSGNHHSHHTLGMEHLSPGDIASIQAIARKNGYKTMCQLLVTFRQSGAKYRNSGRVKPQGRKTGKRFWNRSRKTTADDNLLRALPVTVHAFAYDDALSGKKPVGCPIKVIPGISPLRLALHYTDQLPELRRRFRYPMELIELGNASPSYARPAELEYPAKSADDWMQKLAWRLHSIPEETKEGCRVHNDGEDALVSLPLTDSCALFIVIEKDNFKIKEAYLSVSKTGIEPENITEKILHSGEFTTLSTAYRTARTLIDSGSPGVGQTSYQPETSHRDVDSIPAPCEAEPVQEETEKANNLEEASAC